MNAVVLILVFPLFPIQFHLNQNPTRKATFIVAFFICADLFCVKIRFFNISPVKMNPNTRNKLTLSSLALLFIIPVIVAIVLNSNWIKFSPDSFKNKGSFIQPPIKITDKESLKSFEDFWTVVYQHSGTCDDDCMKMLDTLYRIRLTKGHKMTKVKLLVLHPTIDTLKIPEQYDSIQQQSYQSGGKLASILSQLSSQSLGNGQGLYLLAPEGFLMMSYGRDFKPQDVIKDLGLLLRARKNEG